MEDENLPQRIKIYSKEIIQSSIKLQLSVLGPFGFVIDEILFGIGDRIKGRRLEKFVDQLTESIKLVDEKCINKDFFDTEEFYDVFINTITKSTKTRHDEKRKLFANVLIGSLEFDSDIESLEDCANIIEALSLKDVFVLKKIITIYEILKLEKTKSDNPEDFNDFITTEKILSVVAFEESDVEFSLARLASLGLLKEYYAGNTFGSTPGGDYHLTDKMKILTKIILMN